MAMRVSWPIDGATAEGIVHAFIGALDSKGEPLRTVLLVQAGTKLKHVPFDAVTVLDAPSQAEPPAVKETPETKVLRTSAPTPTGSDVLHFASVPPWMRQGAEVHDLGADGTVIPRGAVVKHFDATTVTISHPVTEPEPDPARRPPVTFGPIRAGDEIGFVDHGN